MMRSHHLMSRASDSDLWHTIGFRRPRLRKPGHWDSVEVWRFEEIASEMRRIPLVEWRAEAAAKLMDEGLSQPGHGHLSQPNVQVERPRAFPTQVLSLPPCRICAPFIVHVAGQSPHSPGGELPDNFGRIERIFVIGTAVALVIFATGVLIRLNRGPR